jgi:hypothetical protein
MPYMLSRPCQCYLEFHNRKWAREWVGIAEKVIYEGESYDDKSWPMAPEVKGLLLATLRNVHNVEDLNGLSLKTSGTWLEPQRRALCCVPT